MRTPILILIALVLALGGTATAASKLSGKSIANHSISKQKLTKKAIKSLRTAGGTGTQGQTGPSGPPGDAASVKVFADNTVTQPTDQFERVLEVPIGAGSYSAQVNFEVHPKAQQGQIECRFRAPASSDIVLLGYSGVQFLGDIPGSGQFDSRIISYGGAFTTTDSGVVEMSCKTGPGVDVESLDGDLVVTRVGEVRADN
jgi:hypothetical protein